ncbi:cytochrome P450 [Cubamyces sp. BRFM 1775]|nr:cytochrome P450 [Cubamyces sp. BRFM 1775]
MTEPLLILYLLLVAVFVAHRLRKRWLRPLPPGPRGWPIIGNVFDVPSAYHWLTFTDWGQRWGDIVSISILGQTTVILNSPTHAIDLLEKKSSIYSSRATVPVAGDMIGWSRAMIMAPYGHRLREMRKMVAQVIATRQQVSRFHSLIEAESRRFLLGLREHPDSLVKDLHELAASIIVPLAYGYKVRRVNDPIVQAVDQALEDFAQAGAPGAFLADVFPFLRRIPSWFPGAQWREAVYEQSKTFEKMTDMPFEWVKREMSVGVALPSFASTLLESTSNPEKEELIKMTAASLYAGGADTTVSAISTFFLAMSCFPEVQRKAQAEIDEIVGHDRLPTLDDRDKLPYLNALVLEVLRWIPVAPMGFPHQLTQDDFHAGYFLPKGTQVIANIWKFLHDPQTYANPASFNPDRFLKTEGKEPERDPRDFCFGFGRRKCPGMVFSEASIFAACSMVLAVYNVSKATRDGRLVEPSMQGTGTLISHPLPFRCSITVRSEKVQALLDSVADELQSAV